MKNTSSLQQWVIAFQWKYNGNLINKKISKQEAERDNLNGPIIRIGRVHPCNLELEDDSVSREHAEIYFNEQQQKFFIKSLAPRNTTKVDGQDLVHGEELPLKNNSTIILGLQEIEVTNIQIFETQLTNYSGIVNPSTISRAVNPAPNLIKSKRWWQESTIKVALIGAIVTVFGSILTLFISYETLSTNNGIEHDKISADWKKAYLDNFNKHLDKVRELKEKHGANYYNQLTLENKDCPNTVTVAISFTALDDLSETEGWQNFDMGVPRKSPGVATRLAGVFLYAETVINGSPVTWDQNKENSIDRQIPKKEQGKRKDFTYILAEPYFEPDIQKEGVTFHEVDLSPNTKITSKVFRCNGGTLKLEDAN